MGTIYGQLQDAFSGAADLVLGAESKKRSLRQQDLQSDRLAQQIDFSNQLQPFALALQRESLSSQHLQNVLSHYSLQQLFKTREAENTADAGTIETMRRLMLEFSGLRNDRNGQALSVTNIDQDGNNIYGEGTVLRPPAGEGTVLRPGAAAAGQDLIQPLGAGMGGAPEGAGAGTVLRPSGVFTPVGGGGGAAPKVTTYWWGETGGRADYDNAFGKKINNGRVDENSLALSPDQEALVRSQGVKPGDWLQVQLSDGTTVERRWDDKTSDELTGRWDFHGGDAPDPNDGKQVVGFRPKGTDAGFVPVDGGGAPFSEEGGTGPDVDVSTLQQLAAGGAGGVVEGMGDADNPASEGAIEAGAIGGGVFPGLANVAATAQAAQAAQGAAQQARLAQGAQVAAQAKAQAEAFAKAKAAAERDAQVPKSLLLRRKMEIMMKSLGPRALSDPRIRQWVPRISEAMATLELDQEGQDWIKRKTLREEKAATARSVRGKIASAGMPESEFKSVLDAIERGDDVDAGTIDARIKSFLARQEKTGGLTPANAGAYMAAIPEETRKIVEPLAESYLRSPQYQGLSLAKGFAEAVEVLADYQKSLPKPEAASDLGLVYNYIKVLDPNSSVMSGEYYTAEKAKGLPDWVANAWEKVSRGTILGPEQREQFRRGARKSLEGRVAAVADHQRIIEGQLQGLVRPEHMPIVRQRVFGGPMLPMPAPRGAAAPGAETGGIPVFNSPEEYYAAVSKLSPGQKFVYMGEGMIFQPPASASTGARGAQAQPKRE